MAVLVPTRVILHCSATQDYAATDPLFDHFGAAQITEWHKAKGFKTIGYHEVIRRTGVSEAGRPIDEVGAHCEGHNSDSLGVCYIGTAKPTEPQLDSILVFYGEFWRLFKIPYTKWIGHYELDQHGKTCPGLYMPLVRDWLRLYHEAMGYGHV